MSFFIFLSEKLIFLRFPFSLFQKMKLLIFFSIICVWSASAVQIRFPDEELAEESVLPLIDPPQMVLNRNVSLRFRTEIGIGMSFGLDEPFYFPFYPAGIIAFNLTEVHALSLTMTYFIAKRSSSGEKLSKGEGLKGGAKFDPLKAPYPQMSAFLNYQYSPYYGKISLAKNWVLNLSIYGFAGAGTIITNQNQQFPAVNFGLGQKLYINKWLGFRGDLGFYGFYGPAPARIKLDDGLEQMLYNQIQSHQKRIHINVVANAGVIVLI